MDDDKIINFPGAAGARAPAGKAGKDPVKSDKSAKTKGAPPTLTEGLAQEAAAALAALAEDQQKAVQIALSGMSFVLVGIKPTASGADFFTAIHGDDSELRNARDHLAGVIERALTRKGL